jgi:hypothetical protein
MDLSAVDPTSIDASDIHPLENRQHHGAGSCQEGRRPPRKDLLEEAEKILPLAHQRHLHLLPVFIPSEENMQADAALRFLSIPDWHLAPRVFHQISSQGSPSDRPLRVSPLGPDEAVLRLERCGQTGSDRHPQPKVGLQPGIPLPSHSPPQEGDQEVRIVQGDVSPSHPVLGCPDLVRLSKRWQWKTFAVSR